MHEIGSRWPACGKCCEVAYFSWMGGAHHCAVAEPEEELEEYALHVEGCQPDRLAFPEWIRSNANSFVDTDERGLHYLLRRLIDNAVDEAVAGYATVVKVRLLADGGAEVSDNGRGISPGQPDPFLPTTYRVAAAMPLDWDDTSDRRFGDFGGARAAGVWIVNALSCRTEVESTHNGRRWTSQYQRARSGAFETGEASTATGTIVRFWPDRAVFGTADYDLHTVARRLYQLAFLNGGLTTEVVDERRPELLKSYTFCVTDGPADWINRLGCTRTPIHDNVIRFSGRSSACEIDVAVQWNSGYSENIHTFVNNIDTSAWRGSHHEGFHASLINAVNRYARKRKLIRDTEPDLSGDEVREGLAAVVAIKIVDPVFEDEVGVRLVDSDVESDVRTLCEHHLSRWFKANPAVAEAITDKAIRAADYSRMPMRSHSPA